MQRWCRCRRRLPIPLAAARQAWSDRGGLTAARAQSTLYVLEEHVGVLEAAIDTCAAGVAELAAQVAGLQPGTAVKAAAEADGG
jgi:hypothetical protein